MLKPLHDWISPKALGAGILTSFIALCVIGQSISLGPQFENFVRFHNLISFETQYFPTALQVRETAKANLRQDRIAVVVGGGSIFNGWGQRGINVWTNRLQQLLGDKYRVVNLAMTCTAPNEIGMLTAETLLKDYPRLIYVGDCSLSSTVEFSVDGSQHQYFFWDNYSRNLIPDWAPRTRAIESLQATRGNLEPFTDMVIGQKLNSIFNFNEFWNAIGYRYFFTVYETRYLDKNPFYQARKFFIDEPSTDWLLRRKDFAKGHGQARCRSEIMSEITISENLSTSPERVDACFPGPMRKRSIIVITPLWQESWKTLSKDEAARLHKQRARLKEAIEKTGITTRMYQDEFPSEVFVDTVHLDEDGGYMMAQLVADEVFKKAKELGYE